MYIALRNQLCEDYQLVTVAALNTAIVVTNTIQFEKYEGGSEKHPYTTEQVCV